MAMRGTKGEPSSLFCWIQQWGRGEQISFQKWRVFREKKGNFSRKVVLRGKGYAWAPVLGSFDNSKR